MDDVRLKSILDKYSPDTVLLKQETHSRRMALTVKKLDIASRGVVEIIQELSAYIPREKLEEFIRRGNVLGSTITETGECIADLTADQNESIFAAASFVTDLKLYYQEQLNA